MLASRIRFGMFIDGQRVERVTRPMRNQRVMVRFTLADGTTTDPVDEDYFMPGVTTSLVIDAGPTPSDTWFVGAPRTTRGSADPMGGKWRGEKGTRMEKAIEIARAFDAYAS